MHLVNLDEYRARDLVSALEAMLELAKAGDLWGLSFAAELGGRRQPPILGVCGSHRRDPGRALVAVATLKSKLLRLSEDLNPTFVESRQ